MYAHFFNLTAEPFRLSPDHRFCYGHSQYFKAKAYMAYAFLRAEGFVMVTGRPGTGKTTLIGDIIESLADENVSVANLVSTQLAADDLLRMVAFAFGLPAESAEKSEVLQQLTNRFLSLHREGGRALLIVDEAQDLTPKAMEELRLLTNLQQDGKPLVQIFLLGQPELRDLIHDPGLEQVHQRIIAASHLEALEEHETREYVEHRLNVVGWRNDPAISSAVYPIIHLFSEGVPRRINLICSRLFLQGCVEQRHQITVADARSVVEELQEEQLSTRNLLHDEVFLAPDVFEQVKLQDPAPAGPVSNEPPAEPRSAPKVNPGSATSPPEHLPEEVPVGASGPGLAPLAVEAPVAVETSAAVDQKSKEPQKFSGAAARPLSSVSSPSEPAGPKVGPKVSNKGVVAKPKPAASSVRSVPKPMPVSSAEEVESGAGDAHVANGEPKKTVSAWLWVVLVLFLLAAGLTVFLLVNEHAFEAVVTELGRLYVTLVTELERGWCRLSSTC